MQTANEYAFDPVSTIRGETISCGDECWSVEAIVDQALTVAADHFVDLAGILDADAERPSLDRLRRSPLGRDLLLLATAACEQRPASRRTVQTAIHRVQKTLLRSAASDDDAVVPAWFHETALGHLLRRAEWRAFDSDDLLRFESAADRLDLDRATARRWVDHGRLPAVWNDAGDPLVPRAAVDRRLEVARELAPEADRILDQRPSRSAAD